MSRFVTEVFYYMHNCACTADVIEKKGSKRNMIFSPSLPLKKDERKSDLYAGDINTA